MIFVTVGTDQPFDRMLKVVDQWAAERGRTDLFAQIGGGGWEPRSIPFTNFLSPPEFKERLLTAYNTAEDSLRFYYLGANWRRRVEHHGAKPALDPNGPLIA